MCYVWQRFPNYGRGTDALLRELGRSHEPQPVAELPGVLLDAVLHDFGAMADRAKVPVDPLDDRSAAVAELLAHGVDRHGCRSRSVRYRVAA
jgi:hypothetical protein